VYGYINITGTLEHSLKTLKGKAKMKTILEYIFYEITTNGCGWSCWPDSVDKHAHKEWEVDCAKPITYVYIVFENFELNLNRLDHTVAKIMSSFNYKFVWI